MISLRAMLVLEALRDFVPYRHAPRSEAVRCARCEDESRIDLTEIVRCSTGMTRASRFSQLLRCEKCDGPLVRRRIAPRAGSDSMSDHEVVVELARYRSRRVRARAAIRAATSAAAIPSPPAN